MAGSFGSSRWRVAGQCSMAGDERLYGSHLPFGNATAKQDFPCSGRGAISSMDEADPAGDVDSHLRCSWPVQTAAACPGSVHC